MKRYGEYMDQIKVVEEQHSRMAQRVRERQAVAGRPPRQAKWRTMLVYCACGVIIAGIAAGGAGAGLWRTIWHQPAALPPASEEAAGWQLADEPSALPGLQADPEGLVFNEALLLEQHEAKKYGPGYYRQLLAEQEAAAWLGEAAIQELAKHGAVQGAAIFSASGQLHEVSVTVAKEGSYLQVVVQPEGTSNDQIKYRFVEKVQPSKIEGVEVAAGYWQQDGDKHYFATFALNQLHYSLESKGVKPLALSALAEQLISSSGVDWEALQPANAANWRDEELSLAEAMLDAGYGSYVPAYLPAGLAFDSARRTVGPETDALQLIYSGSRQQLEITLRARVAADETRLVGSEEVEKYSLDRYPIPRASSVPEELREVVANPIFRGEQLTEQMVASRAYTANDQGDIDPSIGSRMRFAVQHKAVIIEVNGKGMEATEIYRLLKQIIEADS